jgi:hypothetical protein
MRWGALRHRIYTKQHYILRIIDIEEEEAGTSIYKRTWIYIYRSYSLAWRYTKVVCN